ncbi:MAG: hypothetical protein ACKVU2_01320 [Saprospiraceae bacterium]
MSLTDRHHRIECLDQLICQRRTGPARQIAEHLGIRERAVFELLDCMRGMGADIRWCSRQHSYYYEQPGRFRFGWLAAEGISAPPQDKHGPKKIIRGTAFFLQG